MGVGNFIFVEDHHFFFYFHLRLISSSAMASTYDPSHPIPIIATQEGLAQQTFAHAYDGKLPLDEKPRNEKSQTSGEIEIGSIDPCGDEIRESGMFFLLILENAIGILFQRSWFLS